MRIEAQEFGIELKREGHAHLEHTVRAALRPFQPRVGLVNVYLRDRGRDPASVICVMVADLVPEGRVVAATCADHPLAAIDRVAAELGRRVSAQIEPLKRVRGRAVDSPAVSMDRGALDDTA